jgi:hypothetical protein
MPAQSLGTASDYVAHGPGLRFTQAQAVRVVA